MRNSKYKAIRCTISRGGFSDERVFDLSPSGLQYSGVASRRYMWHENGEVIGEGEPPADQAIEGLVAARVVKVEDDGSVYVSVPDGEVVKLRADQLQDRPAGVGENVPV